MHEKVTIRVSSERQEVVILVQGLGTDRGSYIDYDFMSLDNCKVIDADNYSCNGLHRVEGKFVRADIFSDRVISNSSLGYFASYYLDRSISKKSVQVLDTYVKWINVISVVMLMGFVLTLGTSVSDWLFALIGTVVFWFVVGLLVL